jgi:Xaa-Pro dipeptidase
MGSPPPESDGLIEPQARLVPAAEAAGRIGRLQAALLSAKLDAALIAQNADLYYLSGSMQQAQLYVPAEGEPTLFVRKSVARAIAESPLAVVPLPGFRQLAALIEERYGTLPERVGLELDVLPVNAFRRYEQLLPAAAFADVSPAILALRAIKSPFEIELIRAAAGIADALCARIPQILRAGLTEVEFAGKIEAEARALGHQGFIRMRAFNGEMFYGQLLAGVSGTVPAGLDTPLGGMGLSPAMAQGVSFRRIARDEPIVFDFVPVLNGYTADFTRMFVVGALPAELERAFAVALRIEREVVAIAKPGVVCRTLYDAALAIAAAEGLAENFMGHGAAQVRFIGHGLGLELDELPVIAANNMALAAGMVFALEPKFVLPGLGAIGIENTFCVQNDGVVALTTSPEVIYTVD